MAKSTKNNQISEPNKAEKEYSKPAHNRLKPVRKKPVDAARQDYYYAHQSSILANKARYRKSIKDGTHVPVKKGSTTKQADVEKKPDPSNNISTKKVLKPAKKKRTEEEKRQAQLAYTSKWREKNAKRLQEEKLKNTLDDWEKFKEELGDW